MKAILITLAMITASTAVMAKDRTEDYNPANDKNAIYMDPSTVTDGIDTWPNDPKDRVWQQHMRERHNK